MGLDAPNFQFLEGQTHQVYHRGNLALGVDGSGDYAPLSSVPPTGIQLLGAKLYDPAGAVSKSTTANLAMTALDTTNLRIPFTVPDNGAVRVVMTCTVHLSGIGPTVPLVLLGVLSGGSVAGRKYAAAIRQEINGSLEFIHLRTEFVVPGLTPGASLTWDAAYGVESAGTGSAIKYGGPNNTTTGDAFGAFGYEIWSTG